MKKTLIVTAHPSSHSFTHALAKHYAKAFQKAGGKAEILDLYARENQQPFLKFEDVKEWPSDNLKYMQKKIKDADELVFCFPVWWSDSPAILKNWFQFNFTTDFAFKYTDKGPQGFLKDKTAKFFVTADGPGFLFGGILAPMRLTFQFLILKFCGIKTTKFKVYGNMRKRDDTNRAKILREIELLATK